MLEFSSAAEQEGFGEAMRVISERVKSGRWSKERGNRYILSTAFRIRACHGAEIDPAFRDSIKGELTAHFTDADEGIVLRFNEYCERLSATPWSDVLATRTEHRRLLQDIREDAHPLTLLGQAKENLKSDLWWLLRAGAWVLGIVGTLIGILVGYRSLFAKAENT